MDVKHLELLSLLAEYGSVTAVAEATHRSPSAVSQHLKKATREFGQTLVEPSGRGLVLTEAGRLLAAGGTSVAEAVARVQGAWDDYVGEPTGEVHVAGLPSALTYLLPPALHSLRAAGSAITVRAHDVDLAEHEFATLTRDVDVVVAHSLVAARPAGTEDLEVRTLAREPIDVAMADHHRLATRTSLSPGDLVDEEWIGVPEGYPFDSILRAVDSVTGHELAVTQRIKDNRLIEAIVASSDHLALLPRYTTPLTAGLTLVPLTGVATSRWVSAVMRPDKARRAAVNRVLEAMVGEDRTSA